MHATDIAAYTYQAELVCPRCVLSVADTYYHPSEPAEDVLDRAARLRGIDREDESSFDSGDFPKVVFASQVADMIEPDPDMDGLTDRGGVCMSCGEDLI
jgi:hypothetical protein